MRALETFDSPPLTPSISPSKPLEPRPKVQETPSTLLTPSTFLFPHERILTSRSPNPTFSLALSRLETLPDNQLEQAAELDPILSTLLFQHSRVHPLGTDYSSPPSLGPPLSQHHDAHQRYQPPDTKHPKRPGWNYHHHPSHYNYLHHCSRSY